MSNEEQFVSHLKALETAPPASTIEPHSILSAGRRRRFARAAGIAALTLVAVSCLSAGVAAMPGPFGPVSPATNQSLAASASPAGCGSAEALMASYAGDTPPPVPAGFDAVAVVWCREPSGGHLLAGRGGPAPAVVEQVTITKGVDEVLDAFAEESEPLGSGQGICVASYEEKPVIFLVDGKGRSVRAYWPVDACGKSLAHAGPLMDRLTPDSVVRVTVH